MTNYQLIFISFSLIQIIFTEQLGVELKMLSLDTVFIYHLHNSQENAVKQKMVRSPLLCKPLKYILASKTEAEYISFVNKSTFHLFIWHVILVDKIMTKHMTRQIFRTKAYYITRWLSMQLLQAYCNVLHVRSCLVMYNSHKIWSLSSSALFLDVKLYNGCLQSTI